jgi:acyl-CoA synthetase (AMP-forming)/AMP-acid ligase II
LRDRVADLAGLIGAAGASAGCAIAVELPNGPDVVAAMFAVWELGAVYVPVNPRLTAREVADARTATGAAVAVTMAAGGVEAEATGLAAGGHLGDDVALISFTSGTTGAPKPVPLEHGRVLDLLDGVVETLRASAPGARRAPMPNLVPVSLSLWAGIYQVLFAFRVGAPVVVMDAFDTLEFVALVRRFAIRSTVLPPAAMAMLAADERVDDLAPLKYVRSIAAPLSPLQARRFRDRFGISVLNGYGQTELGGEVVGWSAADSKEWGDGKLGSVGRPHRGVEVRTDGSGELWVRTEALRSGRARSVDLADRLSADGWLRTGDLARIDADGFVWIEGRVSDMVNRGGLKVHPAEVEEVLRLSPAVADVAVVGIEDERLGEVPVAFCVPAAAAATLPVADLATLCRRHLAPYKVPVRFETVDALPRNDAGKVLMRELRRGTTGAHRSGDDDPGE